MRLQKHIPRISHNKPERMKTMAIIMESSLYIDPQNQPVTGYCPRCGGEIYSRGQCRWCEQTPLATMTEIAKGYREAARPLRQRLHQLRQHLVTETDPEEIWHIKRRIAELTPMLTQMNELAELTEKYYDRGYWRSEKYTL